MARRKMPQQNSRAARRGDELRRAVASTIVEAMEDRDVSRAELARRLETTRSSVTQTLSGGRNMTLQTLAEVGAALGVRWVITADPIALGGRARRSPRR